MNRLVLLLALIFSAVAANAQSVSGSIPDVVRGRSVKAAVYLNIPSNIHVNSNRPSGEFLVPTKLKLTAGSGVVVSKIDYPRGKNKRFAFSDESLNVYVGRVKFGFTVTVPSSSRAKTVEIRAEVSFQPCTNEVCYPPRTKRIVLRARVR